MAESFKAFAKKQYIIINEFRGILLIIHKLLTILNLIDEFNL